MQYYLISTVQIDQRMIYTRASSLTHKTRVYVSCGIQSHKLLFCESMKTDGNISFVGRSEPLKLKNTAFILLSQNLIKFYFHLPINLVDGKLKHRRVISTSR
jgi:hypothetical protein